MTVYTTSGSVIIPRNSRTLRGILKGEGGAGSTLTTVDCTFYTVSPSSSGSCTQNFVGDGAATTFLDASAGGGEGGFKGGSNAGGTGGTTSNGSIITGVTQSLNGNDGGPNSSGSNTGGIGPGGDGSNGTSDTYDLQGNLESYCCGSGSPGFCISSCCPASTTCGYPGGVGGGLCCRCQKRVVTQCFSCGGGAGALIDFQMDYAELNARSLLGTSQTFTVNGGASAVNNGSLEVIIEFTRVWINTSNGWELCENVFVNTADDGWVGVGNSVTAIT